MLTRLMLFVHVLGIVLWIGVGLAAMIVAARARNEDDLGVMAFGYRVADRLTRSLGLTGMVLTIAGGIGLTALGPGYGWFQPFPNHWLFQMQILGFLAFGVGAFYRVPLARRLAEEAEASAREGAVTEAFERYRKRNAIAGSVNGLILLVLVALGTLRLPS